MKNNSVVWECLTNLDRETLSLKLNTDNKVKLNKSRKGLVIRLYDVRTILQIPD